MRRLQAEQQALMEQPRESPHVLLQKHKDVPLKHLKVRLFERYFSHFTWRFLC